MEEWIRVSEVLLQFFFLFIPHHQDRDSVPHPDTTPADAAFNLLAAAQGVGPQYLMDWRCRAILDTVVVVAATSERGHPAES